LSAALSLTHPRVRAFLADHAGAPAATCAALHDWLDEAGATLAGLCELYAGTPPAHLDGLPPEVLALWLANRGDPAGAAAVRRGEVRLEPTGRRTYRVRLRDPDTGGWELFCVGGGEDEPIRYAADVWRSEAEARRELKRRVLALPAFGALTWERRATMPAADYRRSADGPGLVRALLDARGFRPRTLPCRTYDHDRDLLVFTQTLTAPQLIWPEAYDSGGGT
jgi:hypothetical protein